MAVTDAVSTTSLCPECGCNPAAAQVRAPFWGRANGLPLWLSIGMTLLVVFMAAITVKRGAPARAYGQVSQPLGVSTGELAAAAKGDRQGQARLIERLCTIGDRVPYLTGQAVLSLSDTSV